MNKFRKSVLIGITVMGLGGAAFTVQAQKSGEQVQGENRTAMGGHARHGDGKFKERMARHQTELHDKLKLNATQEAAWKTFVGSAAPMTKRTRTDREAFAKLSAPERMEHMLGKMKEREAFMATRLAALKTFYATLTPEQQKVFNESTLRHHGRKGHGGHHRGGHHHGH
ncbi:MAG: Spy/CpxP family protein refolding chaperone [Pseudomonadota bacterium]